MTSKKQKSSGWLLPATIDPGVTRDFCVTIPDAPEYTRAFFGAIWSLAKWWNWEKSYNVGDTRAKDAAQVWRDILVTGVNEGCGGESEMTIFREKPDDPCEVQYSNDNGQTWIKMFRKDNCPGLSGGYSLEQAETNITTIVNNDITYAGDIINIAPKWDYDPATTDIAMCWAVRKFVDIICEFHIAQMTDNSGWLTISNFAEKALELITATVVGIAAATGNVAVAAGGAAAYALAEIGFDILNAALSNDKSDYQDEEAREVVSCWIFNNIKGATPQFLPWSTALDDFTGGNTPEDAIVSIVEIALHDEDLYVNYLLALQDINDVSGSLPVCPCPDTWAQFFDFENYGLDTWEVIGTYGEYVPGIGVRATNRLLSGYNSNLIDGVRFVEEVPHMTSMDFHTVQVRGGWDANVTSIWLWITPVGSWTYNSGYMVDGTYDRGKTFVDQSITLQQYMGRSCYTQSTNYGSLIVTGATMRGNGINPFRHRTTNNL